MSSDIKTIEPWEHVRKHPSMYIHKPSLYGLRCFISGCMFYEMSGIVSREHRTFDVCWLAFEKWFGEKKKLGKVGERSFDVALKLCKNDDTEAFYLWFEWFEEYKRRCG